MPFIPEGVGRGEADAVLLLRKFRKIEKSSTMPNTGIEPETPCPAVALATTRPTRQAPGHSMLSAWHISRGTLAVIVSRMDVQRASFARDALAKRMYGELFAWLVHAVNRALDTGHAKKHFIGVLDIYGFETFEINSFEQFCINYANEKLQQQFNSHVFKLEQDEYIKEEISWEMIEFYDNQPCIDLIEDRLGVLALLDEQCRVPQGSDQGFYQSGGFLEKNRDTVSEEQLECIKSATSCRLIHAMFADRGCDQPVSNTLPPPSKRRTTPSVPLGSLTQPPRRTSGQKQTVGSQFRASLSALMATLSATTPHYVRCIKPNDTKEPFMFDSARAVNQLRACGVLETIRISAAGFPSRWLYQDFFARYRLLCLHREIDRGNIKATCSRILTRHVKDPDKYQFGATKIFFRAGQIRADIQREYCVRVQSCVRRFVARRNRAQEIRRKRAAIKIQRNVRGWLARRKYLRLRSLAVGLQARARGFLARKLYRDRRKVMAVITIQRYARGYLARKRAKKIKHQIIIAQAAVRRFLARRQYKRLRIEARSLDHVKSLNKGLENKIISLQQRLGDALEKNKSIEVLMAQIADLKAKLELLKLVEIEAKTLRVDIFDKSSLISTLQEELERERDSNKLLKEEKKSLEEKYEKDRVAWEEESEKLANELRSNKEHFDLAIEERDKQHEQEKKALNAELEAERQSRQKLLSAQYELQERIDSLQSKPPPKEHRRSLSDASNNSQQETTVEDDYGYGSVRSVESTRPALEAVNWSAGTHNGPTRRYVADAGLVLRMRNRISALQSELSRTTKRAADLEDRIMNRHSTPATNPNIDRYKLEELEIENKKLREHLDRLRAAGDSMLVSKETVNLKSLASSNYGSDVDIINEDGELATAYEAQKGINRQLQEELLLEKKFYSEHISKSKAEIEKLREENEKYQKLLSADLSAEPKNKTQEFAQNEIIRLAAESLALQIRLLVNKLKEVGIDDVNDILDSNDPVVPPNASMTLEMAPVTRKKEREYLGMFEYKIQDEGLIIKKLISDLKPKTAVTLLPGLPAYILFMMLRHMDHVDDEPKMHQLMKAVRTAVKKTLKKRAESVEYNALWLANMLRLLNNLRQYSGDTIYQSANTPRQNQQCLRIFDLSEYRQVLSDIAVWIYQGGFEGEGGKETHMFLFIFFCSNNFIKQLFYYICAYSLNQLLLRKDLCCWAKGLQIRYNISHLETWIKEHLAEYGQKSVEEILGVLKPITQAVQLLQARKSMQDVQSTVDMCANLTAMQVCKILNMYTPAEEYEVKVTREFIHEIQKKMQEKTGANPDKDPVMDKEEYLTCSLDICHKRYHLSCITDKNLNCYESWICPECRCAAKKGGDNSFTPVGTTFEDCSQNITFRNKLSCNSTEKQYDCKCWLSVEFRAWRQEMGTLKDQLNNAVSLIAKYEASLDKYYTQVNDLNNRLQQYELQKVNNNSPISQYRDKLAKSSSVSNTPLSITTSSGEMQNNENLSTSIIISNPARDLCKERKKELVSSHPVSNYRREAHDSKLEKKNDVNQHKNQATVYGETEIQSSSITNPVEEQWIEVKRKRRRHSNFLCGTAGPGVTHLKAVDARKWFHLWNMESSADDIRKYLIHLLPDVSCTVEELIPKGNYKSFKIGVPLEHYETIYTSNAWPLNARIKPWFTLKSRIRGNSNNVPQRQSFQSSELACDGWNIIRRDRATPCGGVLLAARVPITLTRCHEFETEDGEDLWATTSYGGHSLYICVVYIKPSARDEDYMCWFLFSLISEASWDCVFDSSDANSATTHFYNTLYDIFDACMPKKLRSKNNNRRYPVWFSSDIIKASKLKLKLHSIWKFTNSTYDYQNFSNHRASLKSQIAAAHRAYLQQIERNIRRNPRQFWEYISSLRTKGGFEPNVTFKGESFTGVAAAEAFAEFFSSVFLTQVPQLSIDPLDIVTFHDHMVAVARDSFRRLGFVLRNARDFHSQHVIKLLYNTFVRCKLESSAAVWNPHESTYEPLLEKVQKAFLRFMYKRINNYYPYLNPSLFLLGCLGKHQLFAIPSCRSVSRAKSPLPRTMKLLNRFLDSKPECDQNLLMDTKMIFSVQFPFNPSSIRLEAIELPEVLELEGLLTKI
ncbi:hypothetical protein SFRURICE_015738 [Spodoptera frugiperda]|nr:hypothetical protein SFRURICE_015738 [Spodoptera frugiperda]